MDLLAPVAANWLVIANEIRLVFGMKELLDKHDHCFCLPHRSSGMDKSSTDTHCSPAFCTWRVKVLI